MIDIAVPISETVLNLDTLHLFMQVWTGLLTIMVTIAMVVISNVYKDIRRIHDLFDHAQEKTEAIRLDIAKNYALRKDP